MPTIQAKDKTKIYYKDWGTGKPVVFVHGWPLNSDMWEYQMLALASHGFRCVAHDRRGFGRSDQPWTGYDYDTLTDDVAGLIEHLDLRDVTLVGFSMGGGEVARYLSRYGADRISKAVLIGAVTPFLLKTPDHPDGADKSVFEGMQAGIVADRAEFFNGFGKVFMGADKPLSKISDGILTWTLSMALMASLKGTLDCVTSFGTTDFRQDLKAFTMPTLIIHGDADAIVPIDITGKAVAKAVAGSQLQIYPGAPHGLCFTHKDQINSDLISFISSSS